MKKMIKDAIVFNKRGTEFEDGTRVVNINLGDGYSFNVMEDSPILPKLMRGMMMDFEYERVKVNKAWSRSGAEFEFTHFIGVKIILIHDVSDEDMLEMRYENAWMSMAMPFSFRKVGACNSLPINIKAKKV